MSLVQIEVENAWRIAVKDVKERSFGCHPFELILCERSRDHVMQDCCREDWQPGELVTIDQPKGKGLLRPGASLSFGDHVAYTAYVRRVIPHLRKRLDGLRRQCDYAYVIRSGAEDGGLWFDSWFEYYKRFTQDSIAKLKSASFVAMMDIAGYYEMIDHRRLMSELGGCGVDKATCSMLARMLGRWARISHRGIPQGFSASDVLGKLYLVPCDEMLINKGYDHIRWVDDYRFFGESREVVTVAAQEAARVLRRLGLVLQSAKFRVLTADEARQDFERVQAVIDPVRRSWQESARAAVKDAELTPSLPDFVIEDALALQDDGAAVEESREVLAEAYKKHCLDRADCDKTVLRFLLKKLGKMGVADFIGDAVAKLACRPEESQALLAYLGHFPVEDVTHCAIAEIMQRNQLVASYQIYEILRWYVRSKVVPHAVIINAARQVQLNNNMPPYLQIAARVMLAIHGNAGDLEDMHSRYGHSGSDLERATLICCLELREASIRNQFLNYASEDGVYCKVAADGVKGVGMLRQAWSFLATRS